MSAPSPHITAVSDASALGCVCATPCRAAADIAKQIEPALSAEVRAAMDGERPNSWDSPMRATEPSEVARMAFLAGTSA